MNVAVLIAMPAQHHHLQDRSSEEDGLPLIELGLAEVGVEGAEEWADFEVHVAVLTLRGGCFLRPTSTRRGKRKYAQRLL